MTAENVGYEAAGHKWALLLIADDSMSFVKGKENFKLASRIYKHYASEFKVKYGFDKINLNTYSKKHMVPDTDGLVFGGHPQSITATSSHVGLTVCQDLTQTEKVNISTRVAKCRSKTFATMGTAWSKKRQLKLEISRELLRSIIKPTLTSGMAALCVNETEAWPIIQHVEVAVRRSFNLREKACVAPLIQMIQVSPVLCDLHTQIFSLVHNIWIRDGPTKDLVKYILKNNCKN